MALDVKTVGVVGTGQMGGGIAQVAAQAGLEVVLLDAQKELAERAKARIADILGKLVAKGKLDASARDQALERLPPARDYAGVAPCQPAGRGVPEDEGVQRR